MNYPVNLDNLREMTGGDKELEEELFRVFIESSAECLSALQSTCDVGQEADWRKQAHAWKGICYNLGAQSLGNLCKEAQDKNAAEKTEKLQLVGMLKKEYESVKKFLEENI
jgi:HPt (histidine-containing phosphotransfer) domain-containing protein